jgi:hypothetical protein
LSAKKLSQPSYLTYIPGAIIVTLGGSKLLNKGKSSIPQTGWRRSARPSIRDITIIDEEREDDPEASPEMSRSEGRDNRGVDVIDEEDGESEARSQYPPTPSPKKNSFTNNNNHTS